MHKKVLRLIRQLPTGRINIFTPAFPNARGDTIFFKQIHVHIQHSFIGLLKLAIINRVVFNQVYFGRHKLGKL
jgi:hypothetical protein